MTYARIRDGHRAPPAERAPDNGGHGEECYALAARGANDGLWDWDLRTQAMRFSERWKSMLGFEEHELSDHPDSWFGRVHPDDLPLLRAQLQLHIDGETPHFECEYRILEQGGTYRWMLGRGVASRDESAVAQRLAGSQTDITERKLAVEELLHNAFHDSLTGLPNRTLFMDRLSGAAARAKRRDGHHIAVLFVDLDRFKVINDTVGHHGGDELLVAIGRRIERCLNPGDTVARMTGKTVARMGGDEFTVLLENLSDVNEAVRMAERIGSAIREPCLVDGREVTTTASIGIAISATGFERAEDLLRDADTAMYRAKKLGKARHEICDREMQAQAVERMRLERDLRGVADRGELRLLYQPIIALATSEIVGFEALVRWEHPERGVLQPADFIGIAEDAGLVHPVTLWAIECAATQLRTWRETIDPLQGLILSVNISGMDLTYPAFASELASILVASGVDASSIKLEITETAMIRHIEAAARVMAELDALDVNVAIDDFGTGYSSFAYLQRFPIDSLKIDRSFVAAMSEANENAQIVRTMVDLAVILGMDAVAEGVETAAQLDELRRFRCPYAQGFYFAEPLSPEDAAALVAEQRRW